MKIIKDIIKFFENVGVKIRHRLSRLPVLYAFIGSIGIVLIWRGVEMIADDINMSGWMSLFLGVFISVVSGLFVSFFVGDNIIISGIKKRKKNR